MPVRGKDRIDENARQSWFSHQSETAKPYYYSVYLADHDVIAEMAPTERAAVMRFTFPESDESGVVIDAFDRGSCVRIHDKRTVTGYTTRNSGGVPRKFPQLLRHPLRQTRRKFPGLRRNRRDQGFEHRGRTCRSGSLFHYAPRRAGHSACCLVVHLRETGFQESQGVGQGRFRNRKSKSTDPLGRGSW